MSDDVFRLCFFSGICTCLSERRLCIRCIATPLSSVAKSKPRFTERKPVDMSVRLACTSEGRRRLEDRRLAGRLRCASPPCRSLEKSWFGSCLMIKRARSRSFGRKENLYALAMYRGRQARTTTRSRLNQK